MKDLNAKDLDGVMAAEAALSREEAKQIEDTADQLPADDPLKGEVEKQKKVLGDLALLPANHPLRVAMEEARLRYEAKQQAAVENAEEEAEQEEQSKQAKMRRAKKLDAKKEAAKARQQADESIRKREASVETINSSISETVDVMNQLMHNINASQEEFAGDHYAEMKLERLMRVASAAVRGISQSKLNKGRMVSNG